MRRSWLAILSLLAVFVASPPSAADEPESGFWWSPSLRVTSLVDDNVYSTKNGTGSVTSRKWRITISRNDQCITRAPSHSQMSVV